MGTAIVIGAGPSGAATALLLADQGVDVTLLDRDAGPIPDTVDEAWTGWNRSVGQFHQAHLMASRFRHLLDERLTDVRDELVALGGLRFDFLQQMTPAVRAEGARPGDERFLTLSARRPVVDLAFLRVLQRHSRVAFAPGVRVVALLTATPVLDGVPHVTGVRTAAGDEFHADVVIDASGRRSPLPELLAAVGATEPAVDAVDDGFVYYTRVFRSADGRRPEFKAPGLTALGSMSLLCLHSDDGTWSVTVYTSSKDKALKGLRDPDVWERVVRAHADHVHWLDGEPITDGVDIMVSHVGRHRSIIVDGRPIATGIIPVGDAWACTNPSLGRGITFAVLHAVHTADVIAAHLDDPATLTSAWHAETEQHLRPWYDSTISIDQARLAEIEAERTGSELDLGDDPTAAIAAALTTAAAVEADAFRMLSEITCCLALPLEVFAREGALDQVLAAAAGNDPPEYPRPTRAALEALASS